MGNPFRIVYDDFTGGFYVGETDSRQPKNTWTGTNVRVTNHDGSLVATNKIQQMAIGGSSAAGYTISNNSILLTASNPGGALQEEIFVIDVLQAANSFYVLVKETLQPTISNDRIRIIRISMSDEPDRMPPSFMGVTTSAWLSGPRGEVPSNLIYDGTFIYVSWAGYLYKYNSALSAVSNVALPPAPLGSFSYHYLVLWNSRMIAFTEDGNQFYFSDALNYMSWPTLNYIKPGSTNSVISAIVPRYDDLLIIKADGIYSLTGVLSINASIRQIYDGIYFKVKQSFLRGPRNTGLYSKNNRLFYVDQSSLPYQANVSYLYGQQQGVAAYYNFGRFVPQAGNNVDISGSFNDVLFCTFPKNYNGQEGFFSLFREASGRWFRVSSPQLTFYDTTPEKTDYVFKYIALANQFQPFEFSSSYAQPIFFAQIGTRLVPDGLNNPQQRYVSLAFATFFPDQVNAGTDYEGWAGKSTNSSTYSDYSTATSGTVLLPPVETEKPSKITDVYVEIGLDLDFANWGDYVGNASLSVTAINQAVDDTQFSSTSYVSTAVSYTTNLEDYGSPSLFSAIEAQPYDSNVDFLPTPTVRLNNTRVVRLRPDNGGYGYKHNVSITFSGYRIKRVWVEGESR